MYTRLDLGGNDLEMSAVIASQAVTSSATRRSLLEKNLAKSVLNLRASCGAKSSRWSSTCSSSRTTFHLAFWSAPAVVSRSWKKVCLERLISRLATRQEARYATLSTSARVLLHRHSKRRRLRLLATAEVDSHLVDRLPTRIVSDLAGASMSITRVTEASSSSANASTSAGGDV